MLVIRRSFGSVNSKIQVRREAFVKTRYPEYTGNRVSETEGPRKGKRLGGLFRDTSKSPIKLDSSEVYYGTEERRAIEDEFVDRLRMTTNDPSKLSEVIEQFRTAIELYEETKEPVSHERARKIKEVTSIDFASEANSKQPVKLPEKKPRPPSSVEFPLVREESHSVEHISRNRSSVASEFWESQGAKGFVEIASSSVPAVFSSSLAEYKAAHESAVMFDESYRYSLRVSGKDCLFVMDHFVTAPIGNLSIGDCANSCIVDSKGYVITTAVVSRLGEEDYEILLSEYKESVFRYLAQYTVYSSQSGMTVTLKPSSPMTSIKLVGPSCVRSLKRALENVSDTAIVLGEDGDELPSIEYLESLPPMSLLTVWSNQEPLIYIRRTAGREIPSFVLSLTDAILPSFLGNLAQDTKCGGAYALDMLRMETGLPRPEIDIPASVTTPVKASLTCLVDQRKVRESVLFGHDKITKELLKGTSHRRVGIVSDRYVYGGCKVLSAPHRQVIGEITSCAWSPWLKKRICQAYVKPEYAVSENPILVNVPLQVPETLSYRFKRRITRQGALQNVFRKLIPARVVSFPITSPS
jgi:glycine cleavage system aminomethyltransferase T